MSVQQLVDALNGLSDIHEELLQLGREKQKLVIGNHVDELMKVTAKETKAISAMQRLNQDIHQLTAQYWTDLGNPPKQVSTLTELIQATYRLEWKNALTEAVERLRSQIQQLKEQNERNQALVRQSLDYIEFQIDLVTAPYNESTYSPSKTANAGIPRRTFDSRA